MPLCVEIFKYEIRYSKIKEGGIKEAIVFHSGNCTYISTCWQSLRNYSPPWRILQLDFA